MKIKTHLITLTTWLFVTAIWFVMYRYNMIGGLIRHFLSGYLIGINSVGLYTMLKDKIKAKSNERRISERMLFLITALGGGIGTNLGMKLFQHKTRHPSFVLLLPLMTIVQYCIIAAIYVNIYSGQVPAK